MKLIPITNGKSLKSDSIDFEYELNESGRKKMIDAMKPLESLLHDLSSDPKDNKLYELVLEENIRRAFDRHEQDIDYCKLLISKGKLPMTRTMSVKSPEPGYIQLSWMDNSGRRGANWTDDLFIALYHSASRRWIFELDTAIRTDCRMTINVFSFEGQSVYVYAGFVSTDRLSVSTSAYLGELLIKSMGLGLKA